MNDHGNHTDHHHDHASMKVPVTTAAPVLHDHGHHSQETANHAEHHGGMEMFFHCGCSEVILFNWWRIESAPGMFLSCVFVFLLAAAYESLKWFRIYYQMSYTANGSANSRGRHAVTLSATSAGIEEALIQNTNNISAKSSAAPNNSTSAVGTLSRDQVYAPTVVEYSAADESHSKVDSVRNSFQKGIRDCAFKFSGYMRAFEAVLYGIQLVIAYLLMLIAMTYNVYLFSAVVIGATVGHWLFAGLKTLFSPIASSSALLPTAERADNFASDACH